MNGITVPDELKKSIKREYTSREYSDAVVRDFVKARKDVPIKIAEIQEALDGNTGTPAIVSRLIRERRLIRRRVRKPGLPLHTYTYEWVELKDRIEPKHIVVENGEPTTRRAEYATQYQLKRLDE